MEGYSQTVLDHFFNPRNMGEITDPDGVGEVGNIRCGDVMYVYIRVGTRIKSQISNPIRQPADQNDSSGFPVKSRPDNANSKKKSLLHQGEESEEYVEDIKFKTLGCAAAIASSSMMTELVKGKSLEEAMKVSKDDVNEALGILPRPKYHCSILSAEGIHKAIEDYNKKKGKSRTTH